jgi:hypothetical protein
MPVVSSLICRTGSLRCNIDTIAMNAIFCTVVLSVIQGVALNTGVLPLLKGRTLHQHLLTVAFIVIASAISDERLHLRRLLGLVWTSWTSRPSNRPSTKPSVADRRMSISLASV